jgi:hypothetical protein
MPLFNAQEAGPALHCTALHYTALHCTVFTAQEAGPNVRMEGRWILGRDAVMRWPKALHCTALHCTALHCTALHCTALMFPAN